MTLVTTWARDTAPNSIAPLAVRREYDAYGHLLAVRDAATNDAIWQVTQTDGAGRILGEGFGAGQTTTTRTYFEDKERVRSILTKAGGTTVQRLSYDYDDRLKLTRRTDALQGMTEYFEHDKLDRLECADFAPAPGCPEKYSYAPDGNILQKPGFGPIDYDPNHPHAAASGPGGPFAYDDVGNQIARAALTIEYTPFDLPARFTLDQGGTIDLDYDGNQTRIRKTTAEKETIYLGDLYERVTDTVTGAVVHEFHVHSDERVVAVIKRQAWGRDEFPFASAMEGGPGSWVGHIPAAQQNAQGALISNFLRAYGIQPGMQYQVIIVP